MICWRAWTRSTTTPKTITYALTAGTRHDVVVSGFSGLRGSYTTRFSRRDASVAGRSATRFTCGSFFVTPPRSEATWGRCTVRLIV